MHWIEKWMREHASTSDINRGQSYYRDRRIRQFAIQKDGDIYLAKAQVKGGQTYTAEVELDLAEQTIYSCSCTCPRYKETDFCKHIAAVLFYLTKRVPDVHLSQKVAQPPQKPNYRDGSRFVQTWLEQTQTDKPTESYHIQPQIEQFHDMSYPAIRLTIGQSKMYVVKNVRELTENVLHETTVSYGKSLTVNHRLENFDERSRKLLLLAMDECLARKNYGYTPSYGSRPDYLVLNGMSFDRFFDIYQDTSIPCTMLKTELTLTCQDPIVHFQVQKEEDGALLTMTTPPTRYFGTANILYAVQENRLLRCSDVFIRQIFPIIQLAKEPVFFREQHLSTLSGEILPVLEKQTDLQDPEGIMEAYRPEACVPCYYFDWDESMGITAELRFRYGEKIITAKEGEGIQRDLAAENRATQLLKQRLTENATFLSLSAEERVLTFLTEYAVAFQQTGEVYLSERLQRKQIQPKTIPTVGVSVAEGILTLELDTGKFPAEELDALYGSLLKKKKYHRLSDGRFLALDGSGYETLAQAAHMLQLTGKELGGGQIRMPAFRGLYLQELLGEQNNVVFRRDDRYRSLIRAFKTVAESEYPLPSDMDSVLRPYQTTGFRWLKTLETHGFGGLLADEMGLGKTIQMIAYLLTVPKSYTGRTNLVVCPTSLILNWGEEFKRFAPSLGVELIMGTAAERAKQRENAMDADIWVTSYDLLKRDIEEYEDLHFYSCILDEGQNIKNQSTLASKSVKRIDCTVRFVMTGTPIENRLSELWNLFDFLMPGYLFSHNAFVTKLEKPIVKSGDSTAMEQLRRLVKPFILRRLKSDVLKELPDKLEFHRRIPLAEKERMVYQAAARKALNSAVAASDKIQILALLTQLRQLCCDPGLCFENYDGETSKLDACMELCETAVESGHQILLFSQFTSMLERIRMRLDEREITNQTLTGAVSKEKRAQMVKAFQEGGASVFLISLKAGGTGLNLTNADVVIHYDPWWNLSAQNQATDRAHRIGQKNCVQVYKLIAQGTLEEKIIELQEKKAALADLLSGDDMLEPLSKEELLALLET